MKHEDYKDIYFRLRKPKDIDSLAKSTGLDRELLLVMYTQRTVRDATRRFHLVKGQTQRLYKKWKGGRSIVSLASELNFPSVLLAMLILQEDGMSRKIFWKYIRKPDECRDPHLKKEIIKINNSDIVYSPKGMEIQEKRGKWGEQQLEQWLDLHGISYRTEADLRGKHPKTPDALLDKPIKLNGIMTKWIESKASFGDEIELRKNVRRQLKPYTELFGHGAVVYWFGYIEGIEPPEGITLYGREFSEMMPVIVK
ncbi:MAG: C15orf41 family protein [Thermoplasmata archaeon]|nr:C15orf41 family protein [Thermoplasmata archaeon]